ncbi:protein kinase domain-containing protein [Halorhabdus amylolytica]|uniref:protein kinase domain-containing protein n=1 Tax=Halorhabdus amylolytica TaxID=2559573 RepID=UPI0010A9B545|nr:protein kinase [Halorhabdus amylolytica]
MPDAGDPRNSDPFALVREVLADPSDATSSVPALLGLLDAEESTVRLAGAFGLCLVAVADPDSIPTVVTRLTDRLEGDGRAEATMAYDYLASQFPRRVDEILQERETGTGSSMSPGRPGGRTDERDGVGRVRPPGVGSYDPRTVEPNRSVIDPADPQRHPDGDVPDPRSEGSETATDDRSESTPGGFRSGPTERQQWNRLYERLSAIVEHSRFDDLMVLSGRTRDRYADVSRVLAVEENTERALALRLFHRPSEDRDAFVADLSDALTEWQAVGDHSNVVTVFDVGDRPQPWAATEPIVETLADRAGRLHPSTAVSLAIDLADGLAYAHQHGVIHGGLDPGNVALPAADGKPETGALDNFSLLGVYRWYVTPATCLDPRYAAPEYYDRRFGRVDHATDVYHLGAVLYRLLTGRPPFEGPFDEIREGVMHDEPPKPSAVAELPDGLDRIVTKAMGKHTLGRYETINDLRGDLDRVHEELTADGD